MRHLKTYKAVSACICLFFLALLLNSFTDENAYFVIRKSDVALNIPKGFPPPVYDFKENKITPEGFVLGRKLFYDPILSKDSSISCAFCHQRFAAFAHIDHTLSHGINGLIGKRNVPAIQNMIWQKSFMWDGGINHMELQPLGPLTNPVEMNENLEHTLQKLRENKEYRDLFKAAFKDTTVTSAEMLKALAQFTGLLISCNSKYDKYVRGEQSFSEQELNGLKLFRARCAACHKEPLFTDNSFRNIGLKPDTALSDSGRVVITGVDFDFMKFKVPGLRNVELTNPYMHDGRFKTLRQGLNHYANGDFYTSGVDPEIKKIVGLTEDEKTDLIAFLKTLTDKEFLYDRRFADPNNR